MKIHKEGYLTIIVVAIILIFYNAIQNIIQFIFWSSAGNITSIISAIASIVFLLFIMAFFRKPNRKPNIKKNTIFSPADGKVVVIEKVKNTEFFEEEERIQVSVFMSVWNIHINWIPISGKICYKKYHPGLFLIARNPKSSTDNESATTVVECNNGKKILLKQIAGIVARRIITTPKKDDNVKQGDELGFIKFGSRVDILLPTDAKLKVKIGDNVKGNKSIIAEI